MSFLDVGLVPEEYREEFQRKLAKLRDAAPTVTFKDMGKVIEDELGEPLKEVFDDFDEEPIAAASIGQVYRARLHDGREVAVKVQYPGVAAAVRADMQNLGLILRLAKRIAPGMDPKAIGEEIRSRIGEELDYELEAQNQRALARIFRGHPFIVIPDVITSLSHERMMVSEYVHGAGFEELKGPPGGARPDRRDDLPLLLQLPVPPRPVLRRPAPGQLDAARRRPDGVLRLRAVQADAARVGGPGDQSRPRAIIEGDTETIMRLGTEVGFFREPEKFNPDRVLAHFRAATSWYTADREIELTPEYATQVLIDMSDPRSEYFGYLRHESAPPDHIFGRRMEVLTLAVISQLHARGNFHRIAREWFYDDPPSTELGREEAEFWTPPRRSRPRARGRRPSIAVAAGHLLHLEQAGRPGLAARQPGGDADALAGLDPAELDHPAGGRRRSAPR